MRLVVTGSRKLLFEHRIFVFRVLDRVHRQFTVTRLAHGGANGADAFAGQWAQLHGIETKVYEAYWGKYGVGAGPVRNKAMLRNEEPELIVAFPMQGHRQRSAGTWHCMEEANKLCIPFQSYPCPWIDPQVEMAA